MMAASASECNEGNESFGGLFFKGVDKLDYRKYKRGGFRFQQVSGGSQGGPAIPVPAGF